MARIPAKSIEQVEGELVTFADEAPKVDKREQPKEFKVVRSPSGLYHITYTAGGEIPDPLKGMYTAGRIAEEAIKNYKNTQVVE